MRCLYPTITLLSLTLLSAPLLAASPSDAPATTTAAPAAAPTWNGHGFDPSNIDKTGSACTDFFQYAIGGWRAKNPVPAAYPEWGNFNVLQDKNQDVLHTILEASSKGANKAGSNEQKVGDFYASCMAEDVINKQGAMPLHEELDNINKIHDTTSLVKEIGRLQSTGMNVAFGVGSGQDAKESTSVIFQLGQGGLGLPDRDYYFKDDDKSKKIREDYVLHVAKMLELAGDAPDAAKAESAAIMAFETKLADASMTRVQRRDPDATYHKMTVAELHTLAPDISWDTYFAAIGLQNAGNLNVGQPDFFKALDKLVVSTPLDQWKSYLRWHLVHSAAADLSEPFVTASFDFYSKELTGTTEILPRWKRCTQYTDNNLGEALGQMYVAKVFTPVAKAHALEMVNNMIAALQSDLETLQWMDAQTRKQAVTKLQAFTKKIGYTDKWRDYSSVKIDRTSFFSNDVRASQFEFARDLGKIGKPVDRTEWGMTPPTVNAYYNPAMNEIVFPAGILQPPFYDPNADDAYNYGGMGAVIGHEMTHGFDDQGAKFDAQGNLKNWWSPVDLKNFQQRAECIVNQFNSYVVEGDLHENGKLVTGESIADLGGLTLAYAAYEKSLEGKPHQTIDGFTPEQRFFLGWAQVWATNIRPEFARMLANVDPHPLAQFRVNGPLSNMSQFASAYGCKVGDAMVRPPDQKCAIW